MVYIDLILSNKRHGKDYKLTSEKVANSNAIYRETCSLYIINVFTEADIEISRKLAKHYIYNK